jgi:hypothetical protein
MADGNTLPVDFSISEDHGFNSRRRAPTEQQALILASVATPKWGNSQISLSLSGLNYFQDGNPL